MIPLSEFETSLLRKHNNSLEIELSKSREKLFGVQVKGTIQLLSRI
jgi:hypothetical protein